MGKWKNKIKIATLKKLARYVSSGKFDTKDSKEWKIPKFNKAEAASFGNNPKNKTKLATPKQQVSVSKQITKIKFKKHQQAKEYIGTYKI